MLRQSAHVVLMLLVSSPAFANGGDKKPDADFEKAAHDALLKFDKDWKDYTNEPNYGDARWKLKMETLVALAKASPAVLPLLESAAKEGSSWKPHSRQLATEVLKTWQERPTVRDAWASYDLSQMDIANEGKLAPDFVLSDVAGRSYRLSDLRGKRTVVLTFILQDM